MFELGATLLRARARLQPGHSSSELTYDTLDNCKSVAQRTNSWCLAHVQQVVIYSAQRKALPHVPLKFPTQVSFASAAQSKGCSTHHRL